MGGTRKKSGWTVSLKRTDGLTIPAACAVRYKQPVVQKLPDELSPLAAKWPSVSQPSGSDIKYTGPREVLLEFVILVF